MRPVDPRLLRYARAARGYLAFTIALGLVVTALVLAQAGLLAHALATAARGIGFAALWPALVLLLAVASACASRPACASTSAVTTRPRAMVKAR